jgi:hypothetical protein
MEKRTIPFARNSAGGLSDDATTIGIEVTTSDGAKFAFAFNPAVASKLLPFLIGALQKAAAKNSTAAPILPPASMHPIDISALRVTPGRTDSEAILSVYCGPMVLSFAMEITTLMHQLQHLSATTVRAPVKQPN